MDWGRLGFSSPWCTRSLINSFSIKCIEMLHFKVNRFYDEFLSGTLQRPKLKSNKQSKKKRR